MKNINLVSIEEMRQFNRGTISINFSVETRKEKYDLIRAQLIHVSYNQLRKKHKSIVICFIRKITDYSHKQTKRLIKQWKKNGLPYIAHKPTGSPPRVYGPEDIALLIKTDIAHQRPNGKAVQKLLKRAFFTFSNGAYETIAKISVSHIYNIRRTSRQYLSSEAMTYVKTKATSTDIGERRKPTPYGKPGFLRVDSVHQGDFAGEKGVYHINIVDEVTQWEIVGCVPQITMEYMVPLLSALIELFPFEIISFHSDNGGEYINYDVAAMLKRLVIQQTKSRSRKTNDQALVEGKNGAVIRKFMGRNFIAKVHANRINSFYLDFFNPYLNYHRVCLYATDYVDKRGKIKKKYDETAVPYEKLKSLPEATKYLRTGVTFEKLDVLAYSMSDIASAQAMQKARFRLLKQLK